MRRTAVINVVGLTPALIGPDMPHLRAFGRSGRITSIVPAFPAVTCTAQSNYLTGLDPAQHGIVGNGWYDRELAEVHFWKQSDHLVAGPRIWDEMKALNPGFTCAKLFWWYNMYSSADYAITPRPLYPADGRKIFDIYTWPFSIRGEIKKDLGEFPFPAFWGPAAGIDSSRFAADAVSRWIAESAKWIENRHHPTLNLIYLPHLDYNLQRLGPENPAVVTDLRRIDAIAGELISFFRAQGVQVLVLSEYGITSVDTPIHINRFFREKGWLAIKEELGLEMLDCGASRAFAVADHQVAHIYLNDRSLLPEIRKTTEGIRGVDQVLDLDAQKAWSIDHRRSGDLIAIARENAWFTYYFWLDDKRAPDFARTVDIHRKPGYDPAELFVDPNLRNPQLRIGHRLLQKKLGFRMLMDVIPLDAQLVKGSHGRRPTNPSDFPALILDQSTLISSDPMESTDVFALIKQLVNG